MNKKIILPVETKVREFHGKLFFSLVAVENGFEVVLGGQREIQNNIGRFSPGIYLDKSIADSKRDWFRRCRSLNNDVCTWDEEGLVVFDADTYFRFRICEELLERTSCFFAWGNAQANAIVSHIPGARHKVHITGNPRFDLLRPQLRSFYDGAVKKLRERFGHILLVNTNFAFSNFYLGEEKIQEVYRAYRIFSEQPSFFEGWADAQRVSFKAFLEIVPIISRRYPKHTIIIRPHPSESFDPWDALAEGLPNVEVRGEGNVHEWLLASDLMVHFNCTTGIEAFFLDVPSVSLCVPGYEKFRQPLPNQLSLECDNVEQLLCLINDILALGPDFPRLREEAGRLKIASENIAGMSGALASDRIMACLRNVDPVNADLKAEAALPVPIPKRIWRQLLRIVRRVDPKENAYSLQKFPGIGIQEINECVKRLQLATGRFNGVTTQPVGPNCFRLDRH